jgi:integrase
MHEKRITVWVQRFKDRSYLVLPWIDPNTGKSKSAETADEKLAEQKRADLESDLNNGRHKESSRMSWERFREVFEAEYVAALRPDTRKNYRVLLDLFEQLCSPTTLRGITERTVSRFTAALRGRPGYNGAESQQASTIKVRLQFLHTALQWAKDQKLIPEVPNFPTIKVSMKKPRPIPTESFERLLDKAPDQQTRVFLQCGWLAGLRLNEALALEWEQAEKAPYLNLDADRIILPAGFVKADEDQWVPLDPVLRTALLTLPRHGRKVFHFTEDRSGKPVRDRAVGNRITELARQAGVRLTMKSLRAGFGCRYAGKVPAQVLQRLMRHSNIRVTMDYYANVDDAAMEAVLGKRNTSRNKPDNASQVSTDGTNASADNNGASD